MRSTLIRNSSTVSNMFTTISLTLSRARIRNCLKRCTKALSVQELCCRKTRWTAWCKSTNVWRCFSKISAICYQRPPLPQQCGSMTSRNSQDSAPLTSLSARKTLRVVAEKHPIALLSPIQHNNPSSQVSTTVSCANVFSTHPFTEPTALASSTLSHS